MAARGRSGDGGSQRSDAARIGRELGAARDVFENRCTIRNRRSSSRISNFHNKPLNEWRCDLRPSRCLSNVVVIRPPMPLHRLSCVLRLIFLSFPYHATWLFLTSNLLLRVHIAPHVGATLVDDDSLIKREYKTANKYIHMQIN